MHSKKLIWFVLPFLALVANAQVNKTNKPVRLISLTETIDLALAHNLNLKIQRLAPEVARYNVQLALVGGSARVGLRNLGTGGGPDPVGFLTERNLSYDPIFFAQAVKSYNTYPNTLTYNQRANIQNSINDVNAHATENFVQRELLNQQAARQDRARSQATIEGHAAALTGIIEDLRSGRIDVAQAQLQTQAENARYANAQATLQDANTILANSSSRLAAAEARQAQNLASLAQAQRAQHFLNTTPVGGQIPAGGIIDPESGEIIYHQEVTRDYSFATGFRGALPIGTIYELRLDSLEERSTDFDKTYSSLATITVAQPLLKNFLTDQARTLISVSKKDLQIAEWGLRFAMMDTITRAEIAYYDLIYAQENVSVQQAALDLANRLLADTESKVRAGQLPALDLQQAESQKAAAQANVMTARRDQVVAQNILKNLISDDYAKIANTTLLPSEKLVAVAEMFDRGESWSKALQLRPEYNQARLELERQNIMLRFRRNQLLPSLDVVGSYSQNGLDTRSYGNSIASIDGGNTSYWLGAIFSMNVFRQDAKARYKLTQADKERALLLMKQLEQNILTDVDNNIEIASADYGRIEATRQARLFADAALQAQQKLLEIGKSTAFVVLEMQKNLTAARVAEINAVAAYNKALATLYFSEGTALERHNIRLEVK